MSDTKLRPRRPRGSGAVRNRGTERQPRWFAYYSAPVPTYRLVKGDDVLLEHASEKTARRMRERRGGRMEVDGERRGQLSKGPFTRKGDAEAWLRDELRRKEDGTVQVPKRLTVAELLDEWVAAKRPGWRPNVAAGYIGIIEGRVKPSLGQVKLTDLRHTHIAGMLDELRQPGANKAYAKIDRHGQRTRLGDKPLSETTVGHTLAVLSVALRWAVEQGYITRSPAEKVSRPRRAAREMKTWTADELGRFLAGVEGDRLHPLFHLAAFTGMRRSELLGLRWREDIDLDAAAVTVRRARTKAGNVMHEDQPKTKAGRRRIDLDPATVAVLARWRETQALEASLWGEAWTDTGYVFTDEAGQPLGGDHVSRMFARRAARSDVPAIRFHDLRHTHASLLLAAGTPVKDVQLRIGHATAAMTLDVYGHAVPGQGERAAATFAALIAGAGR